MTRYTYKTNRELWDAENRAKENGFAKTADCYWTQLFRNDSTGEEVALTREDNEESTVAAAFVSTESAQTNAEKIAAALAGLPCLTERVTVYVPATSGVNAEADNAAEVDTIAARLSDWFGGATIQPGAGCWMSETAGLVKESTTTVYAACTPEQLAEHIAALRTLCENLKKEMGQEAIALEVSGKLYFI